MGFVLITHVIISKVEKHANEIKKSCSSVKFVYSPSDYEHNTLTGVSCK